MVAGANSVHVDSALSTFISGYGNGQYFADDVCPIIEVVHRSDKFQKFLRKDMARIADAHLSPQAGANELLYDINTDTYLVEDWGLNAPVSSTVRTNADEPHDPRQKAAAIIMNSLLLGRENRVATTLQTTGNFASANTANVTNASSGGWTDETNATPLADFHTAIEAIADPPDGSDSELVAIMAQSTWHALRKHPDLRGGGSESRVLTPQEAANLLGLDRILVSRARKNTANYGQTASYSYVWDEDKPLVARVPRTDPSSEVGLLAATFRTTEDDLPVTVRTWEDPDRGKGGSEIVRVEFSEDIKVVQDDMGYLFQSALT